MPSRETLLAAVQAGASYQEVGERFGVPAGQVYLIVTGLPADGSDVLGPEFLNRRKDVLLEGSSQHLANPPTETPKNNETVRAWIKARAHSDEPMQQAERSRTAEPPQVQGGDDVEDVIDLLGHDHGQVRYLDEQLQAIPGVRMGGSERDQQRRVSVVDMMRVRLSEHETVEEEHFWPAVREYVPDGDELADQALEQEQHGKDLLQELMGVDGGDDRFDELVEQLVAALRKHVAFEDYVFLRAKAHIPDEQRAEIGRRVLAGKRHAPTRPHPHAPAGSKLAAATAAPLDKARDALGTRPAERKGKAADESVPDESE